MLRYLLLDLFSSDQVAAEKINKFTTKTDIHCGKEITLLFLQKYSMFISNFLGANITRYVGYSILFPVEVRGKVLVFLSSMPLKSEDSLYS